MCQRNNLASVLKKLDLDLKVTFTEDEKKDDIRGAKRILNELETLAFKGSKTLWVKRNPQTLQFFYCLTMLIMQD